MVKTKYSIIIYQYQLCYLGATFTVIPSTHTYYDFIITVCNNDDGPLLFSHTPSSTAKLK